MVGNGRQRSWRRRVFGKVYITPVVPVGNQVVLPGRLLQTLLTPRTLVRSAQYLTAGILFEMYRVNHLPTPSIILFNNVHIYMYF